MTCENLRDIRNSLGADLANEMRDYCTDPAFKPSKLFETAIENVINSLLEYDFACTKYFRSSPELFVKYAIKSGMHSPLECTNIRTAVTDVAIHLAYDTGLYGDLHKIYAAACKKYHKKLLAAA